MPHEMMDRMARAICRLECPNTAIDRYCAVACMADRGGPHLRQVSVKVRAALAVLREPDEKMIAAAVSQPGEFSIESWRAAIDSILAEHPNDRPADAA